MGQLLSCLTGALRELANAIWLNLFTRVMSWGDAARRFLLAVGCAGTAFGFLIADRNVSRITFNMIIGCIFAAFMFLLAFHVIFFLATVELPEEEEIPMVTLHPPRKQQEEARSETASRQQEEARSETASRQQEEARSETASRQQETDALTRMLRDLTGARPGDRFQPITVDRIRRIWSVFRMSIWHEIRRFGLTSHLMRWLRETWGSRDADDQDHVRQVLIMINHYNRRSERASIFGSHATRYDPCAPSTSYGAAGTSASVSGRGAASKLSAKDIVQSESPVRPPLERLLRSGAEIEAMESPRKRLRSPESSSQDQSAQVKRPKQRVPGDRTESAESRVAEFSATESQERPEESTSEEKPRDESGSDKSQS